MIEETLYDRAMFISTEPILRNTSQVTGEIKRKFTDFVDLKGWSGISGVYLIDGHYIGRTGNIVDRIPQHIAESLKPMEGKKYPLKCERILERLKVGRLVVEQLSANEEDEMELIRNYRDAGHALSNLVVEENYGPTPEFLFWHAFLPYKGSIDRKGKMPFVYVGRHSVYEHLYASHRWVYDSIQNKCIRPDTLTAYMGSLNKKVS